jgi:hypothetical protein
MDETSDWKIQLRRLLSIVLMSAWFALLPEPASSSDREDGAVNTQGAQSLEQTGTQSRKAPGMKIYIDPKTGDFSNPPIEPLPAESQRSFDASKESKPELSQVPSSRPGGGVMIDLKGRFHSPLTATRKTDGKLSIEHRSHSGSSEKQ